MRARVARRREEGPSRRRPTDAIRVVVAAAVVALLAWHAYDPTRLEQDLVRLVAGLPNDGHTFFVQLYNLLALWAVGLLVVAGVIVGRWRLARDVAIAGTSAWVLGRLASFVTRDADLWHSLNFTFDLRDAPRFPAVRVGVSVAMVVVASPHLTRPVRRFGQALVALIALGALYVARVWPADLLAAVVLGWGVAAAVRYAFGTPIGRPTARTVADALERLGLVTGAPEALPEQPVGRALFRAEDLLGPLRITALGRDEADAQLLSRVWRWLSYKDAPPNLLPTRARQVEYEAYVELLAAGAGARVPEVVRAGSAGPLALLVERLPVGTALFDLAPARVTDAVLDDAWRQVVCLRAAGIAHGKLDGRHVIVDGELVALAGFDSASTSARFQQAAADVAQLLAATAAVAGDERAVGAAIRGVGSEAVAGALPRLQPQAISGWTHDAFGDRAGLDDRLAALRLVAARSTGVEPPELRRVYRVHPRNLVMAVAALLAIGFLFSRVGDPGEFWDSIRSARWGFVAIAFLLGMSTDAAFGVTFLGNVPIRIPVWPSIELQSAMSFSNLAVPVAADTALQVRFLQKQGLDLPSAVATGGVLSSVSEIAVQIGLFFVALWLAPDAIQLDRIDAGKIVVVGLIAAFVILVVLAIVLGVRRIRRAVLPPVAQAARTMWTAMRSPGRVALLVGGNVVAQCLYAGSLLACLHAFGATVDFWTLLALNIGVSTIASLVPLPGGGTAVSAIGLAGMLTAFGVPETVGTAAVLTHQLAVSYLPAIPGWFATHDLVRKGRL